MKAKITYLWDDFPYYYASSEFQCRDATDKGAYKLLQSFPNETVITLGKVCVERLPNPTTNQEDAEP